MLNLFNKKNKKMSDCVESSSSSTTIKLTKEKKCENLSEIKNGDHIVTALNDDKDYYHFIVTKCCITNDESLFEVVYFDDSKIQNGLSEYLVIDAESDVELKKIGVKKANLNLINAKLDIYIIQYTEVGEKCLKPESTIKKAESFIGKKKYNIFINNDEHFAIYCKTGKAGKLFVLQPDDVNLKTILGVNVVDKFKGNLTQTGTNVLLVSTAKHIATKFPRSVTASALPIIAEAAGTVIAIGVEGVSMGYDIRKKYKENKSGKLDDLKFKKYIAKRVTRGTVGVAGGIGGAVVGQMVIPVPILGALVGGFVGGILGSAVGHGQGLLIGEIIEKVDNKVKEKKSQKKEKNFDVLHKLVIPFDGVNIESTNMNTTSDDNVNDEELDTEFLMLSIHQSNEINNKMTANESEDDSDLLKSFQEIIKNDEYDIYVLKNDDLVLTDNNHDQHNINTAIQKDLNFLVQIPKEL